MSHRLALSIAVLALPLSLLAADVVLPNTFANGTVADADAVNANFAALVDQVNLNSAAVGTTPEAWTTVTPVNGFIDNSGSTWTSSQPAFYKDALGHVHLRGSVRGGSSGTCAFQLPVGYRPTVVTSGISTAWNSGGDANVSRVSVETNGCVHVFWQNNQSTNTHMSFDGIQFATH